MNSHHLTAVPQALPASLDGADTVRPSRRATRHAARMRLIPLLFALMLVLPPPQGFADPGWTVFTSEEAPPIACDPGDLPAAVACSGSFCDNVALFCADTNLVPALREWQPAISEESGWLFCPSGFITGLECTGRFCDNVSVECTTMSDRSSGLECFETGWFSEEDGELWFPSGYYPIGVKCGGRFCDNLNFHVCTLQ